jgi:hypothetical protein
MNIAGRVALVAISALLTHYLGPGLAGAVSDAILAAAAGFVAWRALKGYDMERVAQLERDRVRKADLRESALALYARNSLQSPLLLSVALFACGLKGFALIGSIPSISRLLWPAAG